METRKPFLFLRTTPEEKQLIIAAAKATNQPMAVLAREATITFARSVLEAGGESRGE